MSIDDELPQTTEALRLYIKEAEKRLEYLNQFISEHNKLKARIKRAHEILDKRR